MILGKLLSNTLISLNEKLAIYSDSNLAVIALSSVGISFVNDKILLITAKPYSENRDINFETVKDDFPH